MHFVKNVKRFSTLNKNVIYLLDVGGLLTKFSASKMQIYQNMGEKLQMYTVSQKTGPLLPFAITPTVLV